MKNLPLTVQIWLVIAGIVFSLFVCIALFLPTILKSFFTYQIYGIINDSQKSITVMTQETQVNPGLIQVFPVDKVDKLEVTIDAAPLITTFKPISVEGILKTDLIQQGPLVGHLTFSDTVTINPASVSGIPQEFLQAVTSDAAVQEIQVQEYAKEIREQTLFYVIRKEEIQGQPGYLVSYSWGNYRNDLVSSMYSILVLAMLAVFILSWLPSLWLSRYLSRPLVEMETNIARIAQRDWHSPFVLNRTDEIGKLAQSFENMRRRLVKQDQAQQSYLQNISHELKTPVMVIRSYAHSILDGIYPNETLERSVEVIDQEAVRLEKRIRDLLLLNKLKYVEANSAGQDFAPFDLSEVISHTVNRFRCRRSDIRWEVDLPVLMLNGNREQWGIVIENILDNQIRFAADTIMIAPVDQDGSYTAVVKILNDGPPIEEDVAQTAFDPFKTGPAGDYGLGLAIVKQIVRSHQADIWVEPEEGGTAFYIRLPV